MLGCLSQAILKHVDWGYRAQTWNGQSVFHLAARYGRVDVLETVVEAVRYNPAGPDQWKKLLRCVLEVRSGEGRRCLAWRGSASAGARAGPGGEARVRVQGFVGRLGRTWLRVRSFFLGARSTAQ